MKIFNFPFLICTKEIQQKNQTGTENDFFEKKLFMGKQTHPTGAKRSNRQGLRKKAVAVFTRLNTSLEETPQPGEAKLLINSTAHK